MMYGAITNGSPTFYMQLTQADKDSIREAIEREMQNEAMYQGLTNGHSYKIWEMMHGKTKGTTIAEVIKAVMWLWYSNNLSILNIAIPWHYLFVKKIGDKLMSYTTGSGSIDAYECVVKILEEIELPCIMVWVNSNQQPAEVVHMPLFQCGDVLEVKGKGDVTVVGLERIVGDDVTPFVYTVKVSGMVRFKLYVRVESEQDGYWLASLDINPTERFVVSKKPNNTKEEA